MLDFGVRSGEAAYSFAYAMELEGRPNCKQQRGCK